MSMQHLVVVVLMMVAAASIFYVFVYPHMSGQVKAEKRQAQFKQSKAKRTSDRAVDPNKRRQQILESVKDIEGTSKKKQKTLEARLVQAGFSIEPKKFYIVSGLLGVAVAAGVFVVNGNPLVALGVGVCCALGLPRWILSFLIKRRLSRFLNEFPVAVEIIIRGVKAGLPLGDCLRVIAGESAEPVRSEFRQVIEATTMGLPLGEAVERLYERVPVSEANFFSIVLNIQAKSGGNLSEALGNLARVLRERKKMQQKVHAMSSEAKASAGIIGSLPFCVTGLLYLSSPKYISLLWMTSGGRTVMAICGFWMFVGVMSMKKMINFDM